jgi:flagellar motor switch protein FliG
MILHATRPEGETHSGLRKAAMLMVVLGEEASAALLNQFNEDEVQAVSREVAKISSVTPDQAESVLQEFQHLANAGDYVSRGGMEYASKLLGRALNPDRAKRMLDRLSWTVGDDTTSLDALQKADPAQLAKFIHNEHPQTIALLLSHMNASQGAGLLGSLVAGRRADILHRMASLDQVSPETIVQISSVIGQKLKSLGAFSHESYGGVRAVAEVLNRLDANSSREILEQLDQKDLNLSQTIRHLMFVFEDLLVLDPMGLKELLNKVDRKVLTVALKGTSEQLRNKLLGCLSQRGAAMLKEDMEALGPTKIKDVEAAQQQIIANVRELEAAGVLNLKGAVGEQYVV